MMITLHDLYAEIKEKSGEELTDYLKSIKINIIPLDEYHCHVCGIDLRKLSERFCIDGYKHYCAEHYYKIGLPFPQ
jgi:hypothetical protein